jgi:hypothetical protein
VHVQRAEKNVKRLLAHLVYDACKYAENVQLKIGKIDRRERVNWKKLQNRSIDITRVFSPQGFGFFFW